MKAQTAARVLLLGGGVWLSSCANTVPPKQFRTFLVPPSLVKHVPAEPPATIDPPAVTIAWYDAEVPNPIGALPSVPRPSDTDFLIKKADDRFAAGKRALQEERAEDARREFDRVIDVLATAPENLPDRARLERHVEELAESIYRYDVDSSAADLSDSDVGFEKSPIDDLLQMTFPIDPSLRNKVQEQIRVTASQLPLEENDAVVSYINFFSSPRGKKILAFGLKRSGRYKPMIERILREEGVPEELIFLAQAESGFSPRAQSRALCVGVWQFAAFRGRQYGLMQTPATDDRMDPERATQAAARHLHDLYNHFGDWYLAMAAYNCGPGCIDHAIERTGYADFWTLRRLNVLPKETANYVPAILAMTIIAKNARDYGLDDIDLDQPVEYDTVELESPTHLALIADAVDRPLAEIRELNPSMIRLVAPAGAVLHLPKGTMPQLRAALQVVPVNRRDSWRLHRLQIDDSFATLGKRYSTGVAMLSAANHDVLPEAGGFAVIPAAYPGDRVSTRSTPKTRPAAESTIGRGVAVRKTAGTAAFAKKAALAKKTIPGATSQVTKPITREQAPKERAGKEHAAAPSQKAPGKTPHAGAATPRGAGTHAG